MKLILQILFLLLTWFTNLANATPVITKVVLPSYEVSFLKTENVNEENVVKIGVQKFEKRVVLKIKLFLAMWSVSLPTNILYQFFVFCLNGT